MTQEVATATSPATTTGDQALEAGNYEVIRTRLVEQGKELGRRAEALNQKRKETFGGTELQVIGTPRIRTENNCVPRDIIQAGGLLLFGYAVHMGLKSETKVSDVLALHHFNRDASGFDCPAAGMGAVGGFLQNAQFEKDFANLYKYTKDAGLLRLTKSEQHLFAVFQIGTTYHDAKAFRWRLEGDGSLVYVDDRGERDKDFQLPPSHVFEWQTPDIDWQEEGRHIRVLDKVFVSNLNHRLSLRVEDNSAKGRRVWSEQVEDGNQGISDLGIEYAEVGPLVLLKLTPFREETPRYVVFNTKTQSAVRIDAIGLACQQLPEDHGIIFPGGYYLSTGDYKIFEQNAAKLAFTRRILSPNGEDVMYVFHGADDGSYFLFPYNLIRKEVQTPIHCHGYSLFDNGLLVVFRAQSNEPTRVHPLQVWETPFTSAEFAAEAPTDGSFLANVGNAELVRGISDAFSIVRLINNAQPTRQIFEDLIATTTRSLDQYYWLDHQDVGLKATLEQVSKTAELIVDEFEKVVAFKQQAEKELQTAEERYQDLSRDLRTEHFKKVDPFLDALTALRSLRGHAITLRDVRYIDLARLAQLEETVKQRFDEVSKDCVGFLLRAEALQPLKQDLEGILGQLDTVQKAADAMPLKKKVDGTAEGLDLLSEVVANLDIDDATQRTRILEGISDVFSNLNRVRATVDGKRKQLMAVEGKAEFAAQFALLGQSVSSALALCDTPEKCDEQLSRLTVSLEELEGRFSELEEYLGDLAQKREEIQDAFTSKKQQLLDERQRRIGTLATAADRIIEGIARRARSSKSSDELNAYFASDAMVMKVRQLGEQLSELGDSVKADSLIAKLQSSRQDALRGLRDKLELFEGAENLIKLGRHRFSVNTQKLELSMVPRDDRMALHLAGTDFYQMVDDAAFNTTQRFWPQTLVSENSQVYRGEYLAACILADAEAGKNGLDVAGLHNHLRSGTLGEMTRSIAQQRYDEGYDRGTHDSDAAAILEKLINLREAAGLLRFAPTPRALAVLFWDHHTDATAKKRWHLMATSLGRLRQSLGHTDAMAALARELSLAVEQFVREHELAQLELFTPQDVRVAGEYLVEELVDERPHFATSQEAKLLVEGLLRHIDLHGNRPAFDEDMRTLEGELREKLALARAWVQAYLSSTADKQSKHYLVNESAVMLCDTRIDREPSSALTDAQVSGLFGQHPRIAAGVMTLRIDEFLTRLDQFRNVEVPAYRAYRTLRHDIIERERVSLRLDEFIPRVMTAFVRNKLINDVYLPLIGDNLAKQIGAAGEAKRTDLMGLLLLVSPPGYGKTTLMEYIANRLGLVFVKVNGPALGHGVVSLDPADAPNATSRQEVEKISLAFEMGNNVMLYLDDIQHTHPELLQKFISLCDAQRRVEGVWKGRTRTYDMRGKKFCVVMAGNPYTESGDKFQIPDMLANRADTYNLGDILEGKGEAFALSYIENALTSNPTLQPLATREQSDVYTLIRMAQGEEIPTTDLKHGYSSVEINEIKSVLSHTFRVQRVLLMVNQMYIASASQDDKFRTEPPFKLQGSYRNMNRLAEKIVAVMNDAEVEQLIEDHYLGESQTLTTGAEQNLLKLADMRGSASEEQKARWALIKEEFVRQRRMGGGADDPVTRVTGTLSGLSEDLTGIKQVLEAGANKGLDIQLGKLSADLTAIKDALSDGGSGELDKSIGRLARYLSQIKTLMEKNGGAGKLDTVGQELEGIRRALESFQEPPDVTRQLLEQQRQLIEGTLVPLVQSLAERRDAP